MGSPVPLYRSARRIFLSAEWRHLAMLNYAVDRDLLLPYVPFGTELDSFGGQTFVSLVGFRFLRTKVLGVPVPFHRDFDEVNLRFYVRRREGDVTRRGVVFIREIVPRYAIAGIARVVYNENYVCLPMTHRIDEAAAEYRWRVKGNWNRMFVRASGEAAVPCEGSCEQFITEHYWGYAVQRDGGAMEYEVEHERWRVWRAGSAGFEGEMTALYGAEFNRILSRTPDSALLAEGSAVVVYAGKRIE
jgi:uncharacterized protein YqjF (DUF2071 family)